MRGCCFNDFGTDYRVLLCRLLIQALCSKIRRKLQKRNRPTLSDVLFPILLQSAACGCGNKYIGKSGKLMYDRFMFEEKKLFSGKNMRHYGYFKA